MKRFVLLLLLGVSTVSFAAVAPVDSNTMPLSKVTRSNATKMKMMVKARKLPNSIGKEPVADLQRYRGAVTMDNVKAIENMSRLMQDDPNRLIQQLAGPGSEVNFEVDQRKMGTDDIVEDYVASPETDDPAEKLGGLNTPELLGSFASARHSEEALKEMHQAALRQIESIGHENLGQKSVPIRMPMTVEEIKEMGIDTRRLPRGWEETLKKAEENRKLYQQQGARKQKEAARNKTDRGKQGVANQTATDAKKKATNVANPRSSAKTLQRRK